MTAPSTALAVIEAARAYLACEEHCLKAEKALEEALARYDAEQAQLQEQIGSSVIPDRDQDGGQPYAEKWRHKRRGTTYMIIGTARVQAIDSILEDDLVVVYQADSDGSLWVRGTDEFYDGRFERVPPTVACRQNKAPNTK